MELEGYGDDLRFISEYPLTSEPLRIDVLIVKKAGAVSVKKNIAAIFGKSTSWNTKAQQVTARHSRVDE